MYDRPYKQTFESPVGLPSEKEAREVLGKIRDCHPASCGWEEINGYVEKREDGWYAVRVHQKHNG